jgi:hypothetical protein
MGVACSADGLEERRIKGFGGVTGGKRPLGRDRCSWEDNIKIDPQEAECVGMDGSSWLRIGTGGRHF